MDQYKPEYLGKVIPAADPSKMTGFLSNQYNSFSKIYDACKEHSSDIKDITVVENAANPDTSLSVKVSANNEILSEIIKKASGSSEISVKGDVITADHKKK